ncbi:MAG: RNA polymerase sigma factor [Deltaproteobacteria bacterium]|nr:RNA polymerase sigma factor [Candidatus Zymogenaceae bacterium]
MPADEELLRRARDNDTNAFEQLVRRYMRQVYATCFAVVNSHFDADDAAQQTFIAAYTKLSTFEGRSSFGTWLIRIAVNQSRTILRRRKSRAFIGLVDDPPDPRPDILSELSARRDERNLKEAVLRLPEKQRLSVVLRLNQGLPFARISEILSISEGAARTNYHYGIQKIMRDISKAENNDNGGN